MKPVEIKPDGVYLNGEKTLLLSGDFHYFRTLPGGWKRRMELMRDFGLNATTTYVAWNLHEPKRGEYCFEGLADLPRYLETAAEVGLKVILRCSPYMCAEFEFGGLPAWLLTDRRICLRSSDPLFTEPLTEYYKVLGEVIKPYLFTNGGPIILVGLENEYGSFGDDREYLQMLSDLCREIGIDVPIISANGSDPFKYINGTLPENWNGIDCGARPGAKGELELLRGYQPDKPLMHGEAWVGNIQFWGKPFHVNTGIAAQADYIRTALPMGVNPNFYMFCGGTNFGFLSGALTVNEKGQYIPLMTSYDYDAPISEEGTPRAKYFAMRDALDECLGKPAREHIAPAWEAQELTIELTETARLFDNLDALGETRVFCHRTQCMEDLGQDYGFILYTTHLRYTDDRVRKLHIDGLCDRAAVYLDGKYLGSIMRDLEEPDISFTIPEEGADLSILVENCGRINYGYRMYQNKGITGCVRFDIINPDGSKLYNYAACMGFDTVTLPFKSIPALKPGEYDGTPCIYSGKFRAKPGVDTFLDMKGWRKGVVFVNGFNIGRYWEIGPQRTLYLPGELLREENEIQVFELHEPKADRTIAAIDHSLLSEEVQPDPYTEHFELK